MPTFAQLLAPIVMLLPALGTVEQSRDAIAAPQTFQPSDAEQVRIEQRVTIRVSPRPVPMPMDVMMLERDVSNRSEPRYVERKMGKCLPIGAISGVQPISDSRLLLMLQDRKMVSVQLEKGCQGREFYSGFIVSRSADGQICQGRDPLLSRSGMSCGVKSFSQLVPSGE